MNNAYGSARRPFCCEPPAAPHAAMIDYARQNMSDYYLSPTQTAPARLDDFNVFKKGTSFTYSLYEMDHEVDSNGYYNLLNVRDYRCDMDSWKTKVVDEWNPDESVAWIYDCAISYGFSELDIPFYNFRVFGQELRNMRCEEIIDLMMHPNVSPDISRSIGNMIYDKLQCRLDDEMRQPSVLRYPDSSHYQHHEQTMLTDLDSWDYRRGYGSDYKPNDMSLLNSADSSDDHEDGLRLSEAASPAGSSGSDGSNGEDDDKRKPFKRPPGRPKGSIKKPKKTPRSVSVPQFLRDLLLDERFCPSIIKWEDHSLGKFRFVKPDEVAKLWGTMKQNDNMTFEKFSRAMRYHYQHAVLVSVPTARLVYQFGPKGPDFKTSNPNFVKVKCELDNQGYSNS